MSAPLLVQQALRDGLTLQNLQDDYHLLVKRHADFNNLVLLKYHQLDSPMGLPLVQQCRGLILDEADDWRVISRPFDKFWNYGEGHAANIDWTTARVQEKLDGSLVTMYWYGNAWRVATSGTPDAFGVVNGHEFTFRDLFWRVFQEEGYRLPDGESDGCMNFMFELLTPFNRVVVRHEDNHLRLIGLRNRVTGQEVPVDLGYMVGFNPVAQFPLTNLDDALATFATMDPLHQEGYVIVDANFNRIKVKHPGYVALHHLKGDGMGPKRLVELLRSNEHTEFVTYFPEWKDEFEKVQAAWQSLVTTISQTYFAHHDIQSQKDFALTVKGYPYSGVLFALRKGKVASIEVALKDMHIDKLLSLLDVKEGKEHAV